MCHLKITKALGAGVVSSLYILQRQKFFWSMGTDAQFTEASN